MNKNDTLVSAELILKSKSGNTLATSEPVTSNNIEKYRPTQATIDTAIEELKKLGFSVPQVGLTISIVGTVKNFEKAFRINPKFIQTRDKVKANQDVVIPESLKNVVEKIVFPTPPEYFK
jgi:subtilase family serine protease